MAVSSILTQLQAIMSSPSYATRIPQEVREKIAANGFGTAGQYEPEEYNAIYGQLLNMVAKQQNFSFQYAGIDFEKYNKGFLAYGDAIIDNYIDIADVKPLHKLINAAGDNGGVDTVDPYKINWANVKTAYYVGTYGLRYKVTTRITDVKQAFISENNVTNFISQCKNVLPESLKLDRYLIFRNMLASSTIYAVSKDFSVTASNENEPIFTAEQALTIISQIKNYSEALENNNNVYNKLGVYSNTPLENRVLFINKGIYNALATAMKNVYHNEIDFGVGRIELIPDFGETALTSGQFAAILDDRGIYLYNTLDPYMWDIWNGEALYWNTSLSYQGKIAYALHRNSVRFTLSETPVTPTPTGGNG